MGENIVKNKSFSFALRIVRVVQFLKAEKREFILYKQLLRSGTSVGAMIREAEFAETKKDFIHKMSIVQKEINETIYWLELLHETDFLPTDQYNSINLDAIEIIKLVTAIIKSAKNRQSITIKH